MIPWLFLSTILEAPAYGTAPDNRGGSDFRGATGRGEATSTAISATMSYQVGQAAKQAKPD